LELEEVKGVTAGQVVRWWPPGGQKVVASGWKLVNIVAKRTGLCRLVERERG